MTVQCPTLSRMEAGAAKSASAEGPQAEQYRRALLLMLEYVCTATRADGCAVALNPGSAHALQASFGNTPQPDSAPHPAAAMRAECLRTGVVVHCKDAASDPRTDPEVCRQMGIASALVVPIVVAKKTVGILEVFSGQADNFLESDIEVMQRVADVVATLICRNGSP